MQDDKQSPLMQIAPRMLATEQKPCLGELESNVFFPFIPILGTQTTWQKLLRWVFFSLSGRVPPCLVKLGGFAWDVHKFSL